ncbi:FecR domain-containing protein [Vogesella sp. LIG4]|uniref:FecR family protein n=1 Tax=Vogesella sp. LIG4 TaxID=1192162 RepID=UPI00081FFAC5|nr:FecR domain-containing protein [Vogesella sp. LIG4]SCK22972.1 FecR family protein [Vogesella sp. LIG4]
MKRKEYGGVRAGWLCWLCLLLVPAAMAEEAGIGTVKTVSGNVQIKRGTQAVPAVPGQTLQVADQVQTGAASAVGIMLRDKTMLSAGAMSLLQLDKFNFDNKTQQGALQATLKKGRLGVISGAIAKHSPESVQFRTSTMTLGVRGTEFIIEAQDRGDTP